MDTFFVLLNKLTNLTPFLVDFEVVDRPYRFLPKLPPGKTRSIKQSRVLSRIKSWEPAGWKIRVLLGTGGEFTGIELDPQLIEYYVRVLFRVESNVLCVYGVKEIVGCKDAVLRHRFIGCMRNYSWDHRKPIQLYRSDSASATKLRNLKGHCQHLAPFVDATSQQRSACASPKKESSTIPKIQENENNISERPPVEPVQRNGRSSGAPVRSEEQKGVQARLRDGDESSAEQHNGSGMGTGRLLKDESSAEALIKPSSRMKSRRITDYYKARSIYDESSTETLKPSSQQKSSGTATGQQARLRDDHESSAEPPKPSSSLLQHNNNNNNNNSGMATGGQQARSREQIMRPWYRTNGMATGQQARWRGDEYMVGVVIVLLCFARVVIVLNKFLFRSSSV